MSLAFYLFPCVRLVEYHATDVYVEGLPQPTALAGLAHKIMLRLREKGLPLTRSYVAYGPRAYTLSLGMSRHMNNSKGTSTKEQAAPSSMVDRLRADSTLCIILAFDTTGDAPKVEDVNQELARCPIQGGSLFVDVMGKLLLTIEELGKILPKEGMLLVDATKELVDATKEGEPLEKVYQNFLQRPPFGSDQYKPRYVPLQVGWQCLGHPTPRNAMHTQAVSHAFVEPVLGLGRLQSLWAVGNAVRKNFGFPRAFWTHATINETENEPLYVVQGNCLGTVQVLDDPYF